MAGKYYTRSGKDIVDELLFPERSFGREQFLEDIISGKATKKLSTKERVAAKEKAATEQRVGSKGRKMVVKKPYDPREMAKVFSLYYPNDPFLKAMLTVARRR